MSDESMTGTFRLNLPEELVSASAHTAPKNDQLRVEGWHRSWWTRITELLIGKE